MRRYVLLLPALLLVACSSLGAPNAQSGTPATTPSAQLSKVNVGVLTGSAGLAPMYVAMSQNLFEKRGIQVVPVYTGAFAELEAGLDSGSLDISEVGDIFRSYQKGLHYKGLVGTNHSSAYFDMVCNPSADAANGSADDKLHALAGKKIALSGIGSPPYIQLAAALKNHNMSINDVTVVNVQVGAPEYAAMEAGQVDCMIGNPNDAAYLVPAGGRYLALNFGDQGVVPDVVAQASGSWVSMSDWADAHPKEVAAFAGAWAEAVLWMQDPNNFDGAQQAIQQAIGKGAATGPALETETHAVLGTLTPVWGTATAQAGYNADLTDGVLTDPIQNFNPSDFVAASAPADAAAAQKLAAATP